MNTGRMITMTPEELSRMEESNAKRIAELFAAFETLGENRVIKLRNNIEDEIARRRQADKSSDDPLVLIYYLAACMCTKLSLQLTRQQTGW